MVGALGTAPVKISLVLLADVALYSVPYGMVLGGEHCLGEELMYWLTGPYMNYNKF